MTQKNSPPLEIVPIGRQDRAIEFKRMVSEMVEEQVTEAMGGPDVMFQPFFQTKKVWAEIKRRQTVVEQNKFAYYYDRWGCLAGCGRTKADALHGSLGMCYECYRRIGERLKSIVREHGGGRLQSYTDTATLARAALNPASPFTANQLEIPSPERFYTNRDAAKAAGIDPKTLGAWVKAGQATPSIRMTPKKSLWSEEDVERLKIMKRKNASLHNSKASKSRWFKAKAEERAE